MYHVASVNGDKFHTSAAPRDIMAPNTRGLAKDDSRSSSFGKSKAKDALIFNN